MDGSSSSSAAAAGLIFTALYCLFIVAIYAFFIFLFWRIYTKTGQSGAMSLLGLIPGVGFLVLLCILAFGKWPSEVELEQRRMMQGGMPPVPGYAPPSVPGYGAPPTGYGAPQYPPQYPPQ